MSEAVAAPAATSADVLASSLSGEETSPETTDATVQSQDTQESTAAGQEDASAETETPEEELPDAIKEILKKNRKAVRDAEARAVAAEKALASKDEAPKEEAPAADDKFKKLFINTAAKAALSEAGLTTGTDRFLKMIDFENVEVDDNGNVVGLDDQIAELKDEFKDLIAPKEAPKKPVVKVDGAGRRETPETPLSSAEKLAQKLGNR